MSESTKTITQKHVLIIQKKQQKGVKEKGITFKTGSPRFLIWLKKPFSKRGLLVFNESNQLNTLKSGIKRVKDKNLLCNPM